ncbi:MAG TPA: selenocysteine-specific translation elongation factor [Gemmatimonadaceae bacterium]
MIIGTAGHIDHGKTTLVRALTGVDTDRLPEEKRRGITIELGFAPLELEGVGTVGVVDVPGHEAFVRTMVAGATGIDLALLVVAADEGVMPQTREHLAVLSLLELHGGVVALTKCDRADAEWLELVEADVRDAVQGTLLADAPVVRTSATTGQGLAELRAALAALARTVPSRAAEDLFRLPVDRAFSVRGTGTVVTGTIWSGTLTPDETVIIQPGGREARVRGVQNHGRDVAMVGPATRAAIALAGVDVADIARGSWLVGDPHWMPTQAMRAHVVLLEDAARPLRPREWVRLHLGTTEVGARVVAPGGPVAPGERRTARVVLDAPLVARAGDRFVLRRASPLTTIGGGTVVDPLPPRRRARPWPADAAAPEARLELILSESAATGVEASTLAIRLGLAPAALRRLLETTSGLVEVDRRLYSARELERRREAIEQAVDAYHARHPLDEGMPVSQLRSAMSGAPALTDAALARLVGDGRLVLRESLAARPGWQPRLTPEQLRLRDTLLAELRAAGAEPPDVASLTAMHHSDVIRLLRMLERAGLVVAVEPDRYFAVEAVQELVAALRGGMTKGREYSPSELRDVLGLSRKFLIPFLEYCDRQRITERRSSGRVLVDA